MPGKKSAHVKNENQYEALKDKGFPKARRDYGRGFTGITLKAGEGHHDGS